jgi:diguanylate cyclase (GGDEF)-like protein
VIGISDSAWWIVGSTTLLVVSLAVYALQLRTRLGAAERQLRELARRMETTSVESKRLSGIDALSALANRRVFDETLAKEWARAARSKQPLAVVMADIDRFKAHNDTYGHQAGDECIRQVAAVLQRSLRRPADLVARYGGEEFGVVLPGADIAGAAAVAERMRASVQALKLAHVNNVVGHDVTISLGVAVVVPDTHVSSATLIAAADEALYKAKAVGRNQVIVANATESESETITL